MAAVGSFRGWGNQQLQEEIDKMELGEASELWKLHAGEDAIRLKALEHNTDPKAVDFARKNRGLSQAEWVKAAKKEGIPLEGVRNILPKQDDKKAHKVDLTAVEAANAGSAEKTKKALKEVRESVATPQNFGSGITPDGSDIRNQLVAADGRGAGMSSGATAYDTPESLAYSIGGGVLREGVKILRQSDYKTKKILGMPKKVVLLGAPNKDATYSNLTIQSYSADGTEKFVKNAKEKGFGFAVEFSASGFGASVSGGTKNSWTSSNSKSARTTKKGCYASYIRTTHVATKSIDMIISDWELEPEFVEELRHLERGDIEAGKKLICRRGEAILGGTQTFGSGAEMGAAGDKSFFSTAMVSYVLARSGKVL